MEKLALLEMMDVQIREASVDDAFGIATVHVASWQAAYKGLLPADYLASLSVEKRTDKWRQHISDGLSTTVVAVRGNRIVGFSNFSASRDDDAEAGAVGEINAIYLDPSEWDRGVGKDLWLRSLAALTERGYQKITLWVLDTNERARRFYEKAGFTVDGQTKTDHREGGVVLREVRYGRLVADG